MDRWHHAAGQISAEGNHHLARWAMHKFKGFRGKDAKAMAWLQQVYLYALDLFAHWQLVAFTTRRTSGAG